MSRGERKAMIVRDRPELSLSRQCRLLSNSRSSFYYAATGENPANLALMRRIDELFLKYPFYGSRQMARQLRRDGVCVGRHRVPPVDAIGWAGRRSTRRREPVCHTRHTGFIPICSRDWRSTGPTRSGAPTSPTSRCSAASCTWSRSWTGRHDMCSPGGCRTLWTPGSVLRPWLRRWSDTAHRITDYVSRQYRSKTSLDTFFGHLLAPSPGRSEPECMAGDTGCL